MSEPFLGEIKMISWNYPPRYWAFCDGQVLLASQNQALFQLLGGRYGGNGQSNFALPDLRSRVPLGWDQGRGSNSIGQTGGEETHTLTAAECVPHTHQFMGTKQAGSSQQPAAGSYVGSYASAFGPYPAAPVNLDPSTIATGGTGTPHENRQPYLCAPFMIALSGIFPSRS